MSHTSQSSTVFWSLIHQSPVHPIPFLSIPQMESMFCEYHRQSSCTLQRYEIKLKLFFNDISNK